MEVREGARHAQRNVARGGGGEGRWGGRPHAAAQRRPKGAALSEPHHDGQG